MTDENPMTPLAGDTMLPVGISLTEKTALLGLIDGGVDEAEAHATLTPFLNRLPLFPEEMTK